MDLSRKISIINLLSQIDESETSDEVLGVFSSYVAKFGFQSLAISQFANPARIPLNRRIALVTWPDEYKNIRRQNSHEIHDPIISYALRSRRPFIWREAYEHADRFGKKMMDHAREFNLHDGIVFPIHSTDSYPGGVSLTGDTAGIDSELKAELYMAAIHVYMKLEQLLGPFPFAVHVNLSRREKDVLQWAAAGKTFWEISEILQLSQKTVEHYLTSARKKLNAVNITHAVSTAISQQLILP